MPRAGRTCRSCPTIIRAGSQCPRCAAADRATSDRTRRPDGNPYATAGHKRFRRDVLERDPICKICRAAWSSIADHYPTSRRDLVASGANPDDPQHGRGLCKRCHDRETADYQPGGWSADRRRQVNPHVVLVAGPPCAGKNTYVEQHMQPGDTIIDFDAIMSAASGRPLHDHDEQLVKQVLDMRDLAITKLLNGQQPGWIIASAPRRHPRHRYRVPVVLLLPPQHIALARAADRPPTWETHITRWYRQYEPDPRDDLHTSQGVGVHP